MTLHPDRLHRIQAHHDRAVTLLGYGQLPTNREVLALIGDMTDLLTEYTNTHRSRP